VEHHRGGEGGGRRVSVLSKSGHAFIKQRMREVDGVYGGEMSAHHYFQRFRLLRQRHDSMAHRRANR
jgi:phosphomannomutase